MNSTQHRGGRGLFADAVGVVGRNCGQLDAADSYALKSQLSPTGRSSHSHRRLACQPVRSSTLPHVERGTTHDRARSRAVQPRQHASPAPKCPVRTISEAPAEPPVGSAVRICTLSSPSSYAMKGKTGNRGKGEGWAGAALAGWLAGTHHRHRRRHVVAALPVTGDRAHGHAACARAAIVRPDGDGSGLGTDLGTQHDRAQLEMVRLEMRQKLRLRQVRALSVHLRPVLRRSAQPVAC